MKGFNSNPTKEKRVRLTEDHAFYHDSTCPDCGSASQFQGSVNGVNWYKCVYCATWYKTVQE